MLGKEALSQLPLSGTPAIAAAGAPFGNSTNLSSAPVSRQRGFVDLIPNLLLTTLAVAVVLQPAGKQLSASAPIQKYQVQCEQQPSNLCRGINPQPAVTRLDNSAPPPKKAVQCEQQPRNLAIGINPQPAVRQLDASAPSRRYEVNADCDPLPNLNTTTLAVVVAAPFRGVDTGSYQAKAQVFAAQFLNYSTLGINPQPVVRQLDTSAPIRKYAVQADQYQNRLALGYVQPAVRQLDTSAPIIRSAVRVDLFPNLNVSTLAPVVGTPAVVRLSDSAASAKVAVQAEQQSNTLVATLYAVPIARGSAENAYKAKAAVQAEQAVNTLVLAAAAPATIPDGKGAFESAPQLKRAVQADQYLNYSTLGINPQPAIRQVDASAPPPKFSVQVPQPQHSPLTLGINPQPGVQRLDASATPPKFAVQVDQPLVHPLTLGINPQPQVKQATDGAPISKGAVQAEQQTNRLPLPTAAPGVTPVLPVDTSGLQPKTAVQAEQQPNTLLSTLYSAPIARGGADNAYKGKRAVYTEQQPNTLVLAAVVAPVPVAPVDTSQLQPKAAVQADQQPNLLVLAAVVAPVMPPGMQLFESAPTDHQLGLVSDTNIWTLAIQNFGCWWADGTTPTGDSWHYTADSFCPRLNILEQGGGLRTPHLNRLNAVDHPVNFLPLRTPVVPLALPLGLPVDTSEWQGKFQVQLDLYPNVLVLGYPPAPPAPPVVSDQPSGGWPLYVYLEQQTYRARKHAEESKRVRHIARENARQDVIQAELAERLHAELARQEELNELQRLRLLVARHSSLEGVPESVQKAFMRARTQQSFSRLQALQREFAKSLEEEEMALLMILLEEG